MKYSVRSGIVKLKICGLSFLAPTRKSSQFCTPIMPINFISEIIWQMIINGKELDEVYSMVKRISKSSDEDVKEIVNKYIKDYVDHGYLIPSE